MRAFAYQRYLEPAFVVGAPATLAILELFHPHVRDFFALDLRTWLLIHYLQIPLFPLCALVVVLLVRGQREIAAVACRVAMFVFAVTYVAFDTAAGVVTGVLVQAAQATATPEAWRDAVQAIWTHPIIGGAPAPLLAIVGTCSWSVGTVAAAAAIRRAGNSWIPVALLGVSSLGLTIFRTHAWPGGPISFGALAAAAAWLQLQPTGGATTHQKDIV